MRAYQKCILSILLALSLLSPIWSFATNQSNHSMSNANCETAKIYIEPDQLFANNFGIFVNIHNEIFLTLQVNTDENGIYCYVDKSFEQP